MCESCCASKDMLKSLTGLGHVMTAEKRSEHATRKFRRKIAKREERIVRT